MGAVPTHGAGTPLDQVSISPVSDIAADGRSIVVDTDDPTYVGCVADLIAGELVWCQIVGLLGTVGGNQPIGHDRIAWAPSLDRAALSPGANADLSILDLDAMEALNIHDDGGWDSAVDNLGDFPTDHTPIWLDDSSIAVVQSFEGNRWLLVIDAATGDEHKRVPLWGAGDRFNAFAPIIGDGRGGVLLSFGQMIWRVDLDSEAVEFVVDYAFDYAEEIGSSIVGDLEPIVVLADGRLLVSSPLVRGELASGQAEPSNSFMFVLDTESGELTPVFDTTNPTIGPGEVWLSPDGAHLILSWADPAQRTPNGTPQRQLVRVPTKTIFPIDPREVESVDVPVGGIGPEYEPIVHGVRRWTEDGTIGVKLGGTLVLVDVR